MKILIIPDLHVPYHHPHACDFLSDVQRRHRPDQVVCLGDEIDARTLSRFAPDPDAAAAGDEMRVAVRHLQAFYRLFPQVLVCESNHAHRPLKRALSAGLPRVFLRDLKSVLKAPAGWLWKPHWRVQGVLFIHGEGFSGKNGALTAAEAYRMSTVIGHLHAYAGVQWSAGLKGTIFGMNAGCLIDPKAAAFAYARHFAHRPVLGCGLIADGVPMFLPM